MSSGASSAGFENSSHPSGMSAGSARSTIWLRRLFIESPREYGSVAMFFSTAPV